MQELSYSSRQLHNATGAWHPCRAHSVLLQYIRLSERGKVARGGGYYDW